ncbi:exocyst complex protein exo70 [Pseudomassariella vexata]|uniref:Exocyst complex protein exo70 n=1 Tax=Pseudomassariella vexata TaxID=1141098 RepID=A0A1Y2E0A5_9PEZI|nr:exocyst complex protein exo70 [Pseudomassariella vexata]ORY64962.1 exocyst complex protein exo70 [Pseudomassariella vexata]
MADFETSAVLYRNLHNKFLRLYRGKGSTLYLEDGRQILDASGGAAVACIGHGDPRVKDAIVAQLNKVSYCASTFYTTDVCEELCQELTNSTNGHMTRAYIVNSGSEAMEAAMKLARQFFLEKSPDPEPARSKFIARHHSYHGTTLGSLSMGGHVVRRAKFEPMLLDNISRVSPCFAYRNKDPSESDEAYVARLVDELDKEFQRLGPETVCAFVAEPVVGAALGCVPSVPGYFKAMRAVCDKYGALLILDEVMSGMGRTGTMHAWEQEDVVPDIQTIGKCLGGGYQPIAGVLVNRRVVDALSQGTAAFVHGHTYQGHPITCAAALEVQKIVREEGLLQNVRDMGSLLSARLQELLGSHPNVGNIRGRGLFWGIEFVKDKSSKSPFPATDNVAMEIAELGLTEPYGIAVYPGSGTIDGINGDHIIVSPPYNTTVEEVEKIGQLLTIPSPSNHLTSTSAMAVGLASGRHAADEEARAEVDVLNSRLEKTTQLTKKIQACLGRLEATGKSVRDVSGPLNGETKKLQILGNNIDAVITAIERLRQPADSKNDEEQIIRQGPDKAGLSNYLNSIQRLNKALGDMQTSNLRANQQTMADLQRLIKSGNTQLENHFDKLLRGETPRSVEPLNFITKDKPFPLISQDKIARLSLMNSYVAGNSMSENPLVKIYAEVRGPYLSQTLVNLAYASVNTAKKKSPDAIYRSGTNGIGMYAQAIEGSCVAEYENICSIFMRQDWGAVLQLTCQAPLAELARTIRELNNHIKSHLNTDCYLAYEVTEIMSNLANRVEERTGELKGTLAAALKPVRETAKISLAELLDDTKRKVGLLQTLPPDGAPIPVVSETMQRLQTMVEFLRPISMIMISLGDGGWKSVAAANRSLDTIPSLASFDPGADGKEIFAHYCTDTIDALLLALDQKARMLLKGKSVVGVFIANSVTIIERMVRDSDLAPLLEGRLGVLDTWRKKATALYTDACKELSIHLFDVIHTSRTQRPPSGSNESASIVKSLSSKDKESIKGKFQAFNSGFDDLVAKHKSYSMEREVRQLFGKDCQQMLEPLYNRFWDRYHEIDKGKGKYVKYDKSSISAVFLSLF